MAAAVGVIAAGFIEHNDQQPGFLEDRVLDQRSMLFLSQLLAMPRAQS